MDRLGGLKTVSGTLIAGPFSGPERDILGNALQHDHKKAVQFSRVSKILKTFLAGHKRRNWINASDLLPRGGSLSGQRCSSVPTRVW